MPEEERNITGFNLILPNTMETLRHARLVLLVKSDLEVKVIREHMDKEAAVIWVNIGLTRKSSLVVGGAYRKHQILGGNNKDKTRQEIQREQEVRWNRVVQKWKELAKNTKCIVIGDMNLDHLRWSNPEQHLELMVDMMK